MLLTIFVITILCFAVAYKFYGGFQSRFYDLDPNRKTPATELQDDIDYCPAHPDFLCAFPRLCHKPDHGRRLRDGKPGPQESRGKAARLGRGGAKLAGGYK